MNAAVYLVLFLAAALATGMSLSVGDCFWAVSIPGMAYFGVRFLFSAMREST